MTDELRSGLRKRFPGLAKELALVEELRQRSQRGPWERGVARRRYEDAYTELAHRLDPFEGEERRDLVVAILLEAAGSVVTDTAWSYVERLLPGCTGWRPEHAAVALEAAVAEGAAWQTIARIGQAASIAEELPAGGRAAVLAGLDGAHRTLVALDRRKETRELAGRLEALITEADPKRVPAGFVPGTAAWAEGLREYAAAGNGPELPLHLASLSAPRPSKRWRDRCRELISAHGARHLPASGLRYLAEGDPLGPDDPHLLVHPGDVDLVRGLIWAGAIADGPAVVPWLAGIAQRVAGPGGDVWPELRLGGAAINALGDIDGPEALAALAKLKRVIRHRAMVKQIETALTASAGRRGITPAQLVERSVADHGLERDGSLVFELGEARAVLRIEDARTVRLSYLDAGGNGVRTAPGGFEDELKTIKALVKEVRGTLSGERARVEGLLATERVWPAGEWAEYYRDHPVTGVITRDLIWEFAGADGAWSAGWAEDSGAAESVRLWHPIRAGVEEIRAWREAVAERGLVQPFKQAFREIYLLTPAEEATGTYSNRFAAHIVHYDRLYALLKERGWQSNYLGRHDGGYEGEARGSYADGEWRAWFFHESAEEDFDYRPDYAATDQVRFSRGRSKDPVPLTEVPREVFSEAMRDVDLFVAVTSIAADAEWVDRGEDRYVEYWRRETFGELTETAEMRRQALAGLLPRTRIAKRCALDGRYLRVEGSLRTYKIHLGSANILMEPDDSYLCVVPARKASAGKVYLPFEDDRLSLILSKAFLLADDAKITDPSIVAQIRREA